MAWDPAYGSLYLVNDVIEISDDTTVRTVTNVSSNTITFAPALSSASQVNTNIHNWGASAAYLVENYHLSASSPCIDNGSPHLQLLYPTDLDGDMYRPKLVVYR